MTAAGATLAIDVGGTSVRTAIIDHDRGIIDRDSQPTASGALADLVAGSVSRLIARNPAAASGIDAAGVGVPEYVDRSRVTSSEVIDWDDAILSLIFGLVRDATGRSIAVVVESDVRCGAIAEHALLADPGSESLLYVSWGTGISSSLVLPGGLCWPGAHGRALALGEWQVTVHDTGTLARLEDVVSGGGISRRFDASGPEVREATPTERISELADEGVESARALLTIAGAELSSALVKLVDVLDPSRIVVGGGLGTADTLAGRTLFDRFADSRVGRPATPISAARHGHDSGLFGIARVARAMNSANHP